jgi:predicted ATPase
MNEATDIAGPNLLETTRAYAMQKLVESGERDILAQRYADLAAANAPEIDNPCAAATQGRRASIGPAGLRRISAATGGDFS